MNEEGFRKFLKRSGRSQSVLKRVITYVKDFERYLQEYRDVKELDEVVSNDLEGFVEWIEKKPKTSAKTHLWAIKYYFQYTSNKTMFKRATELREERTKQGRVLFRMKKFRGVNQGHAEKLTAIGIKTVDQMLEAGRTKIKRQKLSEETGIPLDAILEFVKLSDLSRIGSVKSIRARLYYDAGIDTPEKMAQWDPKKLRTYLIEFIEKTCFDGIATLPKEAEYTVAQAKKLPKIVEY